MARGRSRRGLGRIELGLASIVFSLPQLMVAMVLTPDSKRRRSARRPVDSRPASGYLSFMARERTTGILNPTPPGEMLDRRGRPYFLWDMEMTLVEFLGHLGGAEPAAKGYALGKLLRQAKPDDVFRFVTLRQIRDSWAAAQAHLGDRAPFWRWLLDKTERVDEEPAH